MLLTGTSPDRAMLISLTNKRKKTAISHECTDLEGTPQRVSARQRHDSLVIKAHAVEHVPQVVLRVVRVGKRLVACGEVALVNAVFGLFGVFPTVLHVDYGSAFRVSRRKRQRQQALASGCRNPREKMHVEKGNFRHMVVQACRGK